MVVWLYVGDYTGEYRPLLILTSAFERHMSK